MIEAKRESTIKGKAVKGKTPSPRSNLIRTEGLELRQFFQPQLRDIPLSEAIIQVLEKATGSLSPDSIAFKLCEGFFTEGHERAKRSLVVCCRSVAAEANGRVQSGAV